jgi:MFS family permease
LSETKFTSRAGPSAPSRSPAPRAESGISHAWRALRYRNFQLFFAGQSISLIGTWMTRVATAWLVYRLTHSALLLGTVSFAGQIPTFLLAPFAGVWVDRLNKRRVLVWTQTILMVQSFALAALTLSGHITIHWILGLSILQGCVNAFDMPGRQSFLVQMVEDRADLGNAIAINSSMVNMARLVGPSIAGFIIAASSEGWCFLIDGVSYIAVIASLVAMHVRPQPVRRAQTSTWTELKEGWSYVTGFLPIRTILLLFAVVSLMGMPYMVLMPIFADRVLHGGPHLLGFLTGASGVGALISAFSLAVRKTVRGLIRMIPLAAMVFGLSLVGFGLSEITWLSMILVLFAGMGMMQGMAASNTMVQTLVPEDKRGRVMSYYTMAFMGMAPFGALLAGTMANALPTWTFMLHGSTHAIVGPQWTVMMNGFAVLAGGLWFATRLPAVKREMRPIFMELGIIPAVEEVSS